MGGRLPVFEFPFIFGILGMNGVSNQAHPFQDVVRAEYGRARYPDLIFRHRHQVVVAHLVVVNQGGSQVCNNRLPIYESPISRERQVKAWIEHLRI